MMKVLTRRSVAAAIAALLVVGGLAVAQAQLVPPDASGNTIVGWGQPANYTDPQQVFEVSSPANDPFTAVEACSSVTLGLTEGGHIIPNGVNNSTHLENIPASLASKTVTDIDCNGVNAAAVTADGEVTVWGTDRGFNGTAEGLSDATAVVVGYNFVVALRANGTVFVWGKASSTGVTGVPAGLDNVTAVAAGGGLGTSSFLDSGLALKQDGTVVSWGNHTLITQLPAALSGQQVASIDVTPGPTGAAIALTTAGKAILWGGSGCGGSLGFPSAYADETIAAISCSGQAGGIALTEGGDFLTWGGNIHYTTIPAKVLGAPIVDLDSSGSFHVVIMNAAAPVTAVVNNTAPSVTPTTTPKVGSVLTADPGTWTPSSAALSYQWVRDDTDITGATGATYTPVAADVGKTLSVKVTGASTDLDSATASSPATAVVNDEFAIVTDSAIASGDPVVGSELTGTEATFSLDPAEMILTHQWVSDGSVVSNALTFTLTELQLDTNITFRTTAFRKSNFSQLVSVSESIGPVTAAPTAVVNNTAPSVTPTTPKVGVELTADPGTWTPSSSAVSYQWVRDDTDITDATNATYTPVAADIGKTLSVEVTGASTDLDSATATSPPTAAVADNFEIVTDSEITAGDPFVGSELTGTEATFSLAPPAVLMTHQWLSDGAVVSNALTFTLTELQLDTNITFRTNALRFSPFTQLVSVSESIGPVTAAPTAVVNNTGPSVTPTTPKVGVELTADPGTWTPSSSTLSYQWLRDGTEISGATDATYTPVAADIGKTLSVEVTGASTGLDGVSATSPETDAVTDVDMAVSSVPTISGELKVGEQLTGTPATFVGNPDSIDNQWFAGSDAITGATGLSYTLTEAQEGKTITFKSTATRGDDTSVTSASTPSAQVQAADAPLAVSQATTVDGVATVGETLTGTPGEFTGTPTPTVTNQWQVDGEDITGATGLTYELTTDDLGKTFTFTSTATNSSGTLDSVSNEVGPVMAVLAESRRAIVSGTPQVGKMLTGTTGEFNDPSATVTNQWLANGDEIDGATSTTYSLTTAELGKRIIFRSTATRGTETATSDSSATTAVVAADDTPPGDGDGDTAPPPPAAGDLEGGIEVVGSTTLAPGASTTIDVGTEYAGEKVSVWLFSTAYNLGTFTVGENGRIAVTIPTNVTPGKHRLAVYDTQGDLIGWQTLTITTKAAAGAYPVASGSSLPDTGADVPLYLVPLGLLMLVAGGTALVVTRRRHEN